MRFTKYISRNYLSILLTALIATFAFLYFVVYRTESRVAWYNEMYLQSENMFAEFKETVGLK